MAELIRREPAEDGAVWLTIDRPEAMNALSGAVLERLGALAAELGTDPAVRAVVVTGAGERAFSAGADLKERSAMDVAETRARLDLTRRVLDAWAALPRPTIAAINGVAFGGGLELALACDLRVAAEEAELALPEVRLGILPGGGGTQRLTRLVGAARAKELILLGRRVSARRALELAVVHEVIPRADLHAAVRLLLAELAGCAPVSVRAAKRAIDEGGDLPLAQGLDGERAAYEITLATTDRVEGLAAFAARRPPRFRGQ